MNKKIKFFGLMLSLLLVTSLILSACTTKTTPTPTPATTAPATSAPKPTTTAPATTSAAPTTTAAPKPTTATTPAASFETMSFRFASPYAQSYHAGLGFDLTVQFQEALTKATGGKATVKPFWAGSLLTVPDSVTGTASGLADITYIHGGLLPSNFPTMQLGSVCDPKLPGDAHDWVWTYNASIIAATELLQEEVAKQGLKLFLPYTGGQPNSLLTAKEVKTLDDFKGQKIRSPYGKYSDALISAMGATPVSMPLTDYPEAVARGVVDGVFAPFNVIYDLKATDFTKYGVIAKEGSGNLIANYSFGQFFYAMPLDYWKKLPDQYKRALLQAAKAQTDYRNSVAESMYLKSVDNANKKVNNTVAPTWVVLSKADMDKIASQPSMVNAWTDAAKEIDGKGGIGTKALARFQALLKLSDADLKKEWENMWAKRIAELW